MKGWVTAGMLHTIQSRLQRFDSAGAVLLDMYALEYHEIVSGLLMLIWGIWRNCNKHI